MRAPFLCIALSLVAASAGVPQTTEQRRPTPEFAKDNSSNMSSCERYGVNCVEQSTQPPPETTKLTSPPPGTSPRPKCRVGERCVNYTLCGDSDTFPIKYRLKDPECVTRLEICCPENMINTEPTQRPPGTTTSRCGQRNRGGVGIKIDGTFDSESKYGEFPWMVAVFSLETEEGQTFNKYECGGSLINSKVVLTAAHSVSMKNYLMVKVGDWDFKSVEQFATQTRNVINVIIHEEFNKERAHNDLALLILDQPVNLNTPSVGIICLPESNETMDGRECVASGWGKDASSEVDKYMNILKKVDLPMVSSYQCQETLRKVAGKPYYNLHESFVCAGGIIGKDTCKGDGGSPLACPSKNNPDVYVQAGITAWGIGCGTTAPGVYVNVPSFVNWIENKMQSLDLYIEDQ